MKRVGSYFRFILLLVCAFFLTIWIVFINGCKFPKKQNGQKKPSFPVASETDTIKKDSPPVVSEADASKMDNLSIDELILQLNSDVWKEREAAQKALVSKGDAALPNLKAALKSETLEVRIRVTKVLEILGWYVTKDGKVEKMSESKEFQEMMKKRLPEMPAE